MSAWRPAGSTVRSGGVPSIESLEERRLLSANLTGIFTGHLPAFLPPGGAVHANLRLVNSGDAAAFGPVTVNLYIDRQPSLDVNAVPLVAASKIVRLKPGRGAATVPLNFTAPSTLAEGRYYLLAQVLFAAGNGAPSNATVIAAPNALTFRRPFLDLRAEVVQQPGGPLAVTAQTGATATAAVLVVNRGNVAAQGQVQITLYASTDKALDSGDRVVGGATVRNAKIRPGGAKTFEATVLLPPAMPLGSYFLIASVNPGTGTGNLVALSSMPLVVASPPPSGSQPPPHQHEHHHGGGIAYGDYGAIGVGSGVLIVDSSGADTSDASGNNGSPGGGGGGSPPDNGGPGTGPPASQPSNGGGADWGPPPGGSDTPPPAAPPSGGDSGSGGSGGSDFGNSPSDGSASSGADF